MAFIFLWLAYFSQHHVLQVHPCLSSHKWGKWGPGYLARNRTSTQICIPNQSDSQSALRVTFILEAYHNNKHEKQKYEWGRHNIECILRNYHYFFSLCLSPSSVLLTPAMPDRAVLPTLPGGQSRRCCLSYWTACRHSYGRSGRQARFHMRIWVKRFLLCGFTASHPVHNVKSDTCQ